MTTTTDRDAFELTIADNPDDPMPRLAFADWLEENCELSVPCLQCETVVNSSYGRKKGYTHTVPTCTHCSGSGRVRTNAYTMACDQRLAAKMIEIRADRRIVASESHWREQEPT